MPGKEVRFRKLVDASGKPQIVSLWTNPKRDRRFMKAIREHRVLTVIQEPRSHRKQFGRPGFHQDPHASYLVFPKPLSLDSGSRVIGISYDLTVEPRIADPLPKSALRPSTAPKRKPKAEQKFNVLLRRTAVIEISREVRAPNRSKAEEIALASIKAQPFDGAKAIIKNEVIAVD